MRAQRSQASASVRKRSQASASVGFGWEPKIVAKRRTVVTCWTSRSNSVNSHGDGWRGSWSRNLELIILLLSGAQLHSGSWLLSGLTTAATASAPMIVASRTATIEYLSAGTRHAGKGDCGVSEGKETIQFLE